jgi:hypothetical protein
MEGSKGNGPLEIVLESVDYFLAGKWPMSCEKYQPNGNQAQNGKADCPQPASSRARTPVGTRLFKNGCVTLGHGASEPACH